MITATEAVNGLTRYVDAEILPHVDGWRKVALGAYVGMVGNRAAELLSKAADSPALAMTGAFTHEGIDIDMVHDAVMRRVSEPVKVDIPAIGVFTMNQSDIGTIYDYMRGAR